MRKKFMALSVAICMCVAASCKRTNPVEAEQNLSACMNAVTGAHESGWGVEPNKTIVWEFIGVRGYTGRRKYNLATGTSELFTSEGYPQIVRILAPQREPASKIDGLKSCARSFPGSFPIASR